MTPSEYRLRLIKHSKDCVEGQLLLDVVAELDRMERRIQQLESENKHLDNELGRMIV